MAHFLSRLFNLRPEEWPRVLLLFLIAVLTNAVAIWGSTIAYAAFLTQVGLEALPWVVISSAVLSILAIALYTPFVDRVGNVTLLIALYAIGALCIALGLTILWLGQPLIAYPLLYLLDFAWTVVFNSHFTTFINSYYDIHSAKRVLPVVSAGLRTGVIVGGLTMPLLPREFGASSIIGVWLFTYLIVIALLWLMPRLLRARREQGALLAPGLPTPGIRAEKRNASYVDNMRQGLDYVAQSAFLRWMAISTLLLMVLLALVEYASSGILLSIYGTPRELASYIALLSGVANLFVLPILLFGMSRVIARLGLGNTSVLFPIGNLFICAFLVLVPGWASASAAFLDRTAFRIAFHSPVNNLLFNAVPLRVRGRARAFVGGAIVPLGSLIGGVLLVLPLMSLVWFVPALLAVLAAAFTVSAWSIRRQYTRALIKMLEQEDYSFLLSQEASDFTVADPATLAQLERKLKESTSHELTIFVAKLISQIGGNKAIPILGEAARAAPDARTRSALVDVLVSADLRDDAMRKLYADLMADPDGRVRQAAIAGLEELAGPGDKPFQERMLEMLQDPDDSVRVQALAAIARSGQLNGLEPATRVLALLLADPSPQCRAQGVRVLGQMKDEQAVARLADFLTDPADEVRLEAAITVEALSADAWSAHLRAVIADKAVSLLRDPIERVRQSAFALLGRLGSKKSHEAMVEAVGDASPAVREAAVDSLAKVGKAIVPLVHPRLSSPDPQVRKMAAVVLSRVDPREFGSLIVGSHVTGNLLTIYKNHGQLEALAAGNGCPSLVVLRSALAEQNRQNADEIFYLLGAVHNPAALKLVGESLRSQDPRVRANAVEALESLTSPQTASLLAPLFDPNLPAATLVALGKDTWDIEQPSTAQALRQLATHPEDPWIRTISTFVLGELGAGMVRVRGSASTAPPSAGETKDASPAPGRRGRRTASADLLGALMGSEDDAKNAGQKKPEPPTAAPTAAPQVGLLLSEVEAMLDSACVDPAKEVRLAAQAAKRVIATGGIQTGLPMVEGGIQEGALLSTIEKIIFLKEVPFFGGMTIEQLRVLANVCEEEFFPADTRLYNEGDPGGVLYVVVNGRVGIEQEKRKGSFARLANIEAHSYFGEMNLFDNSPRTTSAVALQDTLTLRLRREPLIALARQHPDLSLELINVLSQRLRETSDRVADLTRTRPRELHKLYDQFE